MTLSTTDACVYASRLPYVRKSHTEHLSRVGTLKPFNVVAQNNVDFEWHLGSQVLSSSDGSACLDQPLTVVSALPVQKLLARLPEAYPTPHILFRYFRAQSVASPG